MHRLFLLGNARNLLLPSGEINPQTFLPTAASSRTSSLSALRSLLTWPSVQHRESLLTRGRRPHVDVDYLFVS